MLLADFFETIQADPRVAPVHVSLYFALVHCKEQSGASSFEIERRHVMSLAKIYARSTFNRCINELAAFGYIRYQPANGSGEKSKVELRKL